MFSTPFQPVQASFWPLLISLTLFSLLGNVVLWLNSFLRVFSLFSSLFFLILVSALWWKDIMRERILGYHTHKLELCMRIGMLLFITSEVFFFVSFFWAFYDASISPVIEIGIAWPPKGITPLSVYSVPLLNTVILLTSGITVTWAHHSILNNFFMKSVISLFFTVLLGAYFLYMQWLEYLEASFTIADGVYGSSFFIATGFHGFHVFVGTSFLLYVLFSLINGKLLYNHHFSFESAAWYWHFVDVVWLFLYLNIYWWSRL